MKITIFILLLLGYCTQLLLANPPQKIYTLARQNFSVHYYEEQSKEWNAVLTNDANNADAWLNYYLANHNIWQKGGKVTYSDIQQIVKDAAANIPNSFEYHYIYYYNSLNKKKDFEHLQKAFDLAPDRYETYKEFVEYYEQKGEQKQVAFFCEKWLKSGEYSTGILNWNYNVLAGLEKDAVLITQGENDTYPIWILQYAKGLRKDVKVLNIQLLKDKEYQKRVFEELGIADFALTYAQAKDENQYFNAMVSHVLQNLTTQTVYLGVSIPKGVVNNYEEELYIVGLAFQYSSRVLDNVQLIETNYENNFLLDYLNLNFYQDLSQDIVTQYNLNYLPAFLILHKHYQAKEEYSKASELKELIVNIATAGGKKKEIESYLAQEKPVPPGEKNSLSYKEFFVPQVVFPYKTKMLLMSSTEITNGQYNMFLKDLLRQKRYKDLEKYGSKKVNWRSFLEDKDISDEKLFKHGHPDALDNPVQNISYEAAQAYCQWYTHMHNSIDSKRKFGGNKIIARLPTEEEWMLAAIGQPLAGKHKLFEEKSGLNFPWSAALGRENKITNEKGCFLANFNVNEDKYCETCPMYGDAGQDGGFFSVRADSYFPNDFGMYSMVGNVAEMVAEKGIAKGGSWFHPSEETTIQVRNYYEEPQPYIGFRMLIEVLDEDYYYKKEHKAHTGPTNTRWLATNLWMDETEVNNASWKEFLYWLKANQPEDYKKMLLDTLVWDQDNNRPFINTYHNHPSYNSYPVVGVSYKQAKAFCEWRTDRVNEMLALKPRLLKKYGKVYFRLPTEEEWEYAAQSGFNGDFQGKANIKTDTVSATTLAPDYSYVANAWNYYNMLGNVAEMIDQEGIAKGGSWQHTKEESQVISRNKYNKPTNWLGFRCICETEKMPD